MPGMERELDAEAASPKAIGRGSDRVLRVGWDVVAIPVVALVVIALSEVVSLRLGGMLDPDFGDPEFPWSAWRIALLWWSVSCTLGFLCAIAFGRLVQAKQWANHLWVSALGWTPVFFGFAVVFSMAAADDPAMACTTAAGPFWESLVCFSAWALGVPLTLMTGFKLTASNRGRVVQQAFRADSRALH
jgi:hypothetical protein